VRKKEGSGNLRAEPPAAVTIGGLETNPSTVGSWGSGAKLPAAEGEEVWAIFTIF